MGTMENIELSKRLKAATEFVIQGQAILDIGSDHAYLPIYLIQKQQVPLAIAGEVVNGPYVKANNQVSTYQLEDKISVRLGDGFEVLNTDEELGTIFICGMGGLLIKDILSKGQTEKKLQLATRLVLQPNNKEQELRTFLFHHNYEIIDEGILEENEHIYEIIVVEWVGTKRNYSDDELLFGPKLLQERSPIFMKKWQRELVKYNNILQQLENANNKEKIAEMSSKIEKIKKVIA